MFNDLKDLLKTIEIELRSLSKMSGETYRELTNLSEWNFRIVTGFITEVNLAIQRNDLNFVYKKYSTDTNIASKKKSDLDLLICLTTRDQYDLVLTDVINRLMPAFKYPTKKWDVLNIWGMPVERARSFCIEKALERGAKRVLFIDDDMIVENTALNKLWDVMDVTNAITVSGDYNKKADYPITAHGNFFDLSWKQIEQISSLGDDYIVKQTDLAAMGFTLINLDRLTSEVPAPYFWVFLAPDGLWSMGEDAFYTQTVFNHTKEQPLVVKNVSILHYDRRWKKTFGKRNKDVTYATNKIDDFVTFDHIRIPPSHPLILTAIPRRDEQEPIATNLERLILDRAYKTDLISTVGLPVDEARNSLASESVKRESRYLLFIDNDVILPHDGLSKMIKIMEEDVDEEVGMVCGEYLLKGIPSHSVHLQLDKEGKCSELSKLKETEDKIIDGNWLCGLGCALIRTSVFRQIQFPWFKCYNLKPNDQLLGGVNEDAQISELLLNNGYKIKIDRSIQCLHVDFAGLKIYGFQDQINPKEFAAHDNFFQHFEYIPANK